MATPVLDQGLGDRGAFAHGRADPLHGSGADVAHGEDSGQAGLHRQCLRPGAAVAGQDVSAVVQPERAAEPVGRGAAADQYVQAVRGDRPFGARALAQPEPGEGGPAEAFGHLGAQQDLQARGPLDALHQVARHGGAEVGAPYHQGDAAGVAREVQCGLSGGVARAHHVHVLPGGRGGVGQAGPVVHTGVEEAVDSGGREAVPVHACGDDHRGRRHRGLLVGARLGELDGVVTRAGRGHPAGHPGGLPFDTGPAGLLQGPLGEVAAREAHGEPEVVLDP